MKVIDTIKSYDVGIFLWVSERKTHHTLVRVARLVSRTADGPLYLALALVLAYAAQEPQISLLHCLLLGFTLERPLYLVLKNVCRRDWPGGGTENPELHHSFPTA